MSKAVVICAGGIKDYAAAKKEIQSGDYIICADGGLRHAEKMSLAPDLVIGDFDSLGSIPTEKNVITLPCEKDYSDAYMAAMEAEKKGFGEILFLGATGTRLDHVLANLSLLEVMRRRGVRAVMCDENNRIFAAEKHETIYGEAGTTVSLFPLLPVKGLTLSGFKYPLSNASIDVLNPIWISNELLSVRGELSFDEGALLVDIAAD